jgi:hypothetical protein
MTIWTSLQAEMVEELYPHLPNIEIAEVINAATGSSFHENSVKNKFQALKQGVAKQPYVPVNPTWTDERLAMLRDLCAKGLTTRKIAERINEATHGTFSKNAICGAIGRNGLSKPRYRRPPSERADRAVDKRLRTNRRPVDLPVYEGGLDLPFMDRARNQCAWPTRGEGLEMLICGHKTPDGHSYCAFHCSLAYRDTPRMRAAA